MNYKKLGEILGKIMILEGALMLAPLIVSLIYKESLNNVLAFAIPIVILVLLGFLLQIPKASRENLYQKEGFALVATVWIVMALFGAVPFVINGDIPNYVDALFEIVSGFTTTGASILSDVTTLSHSSLFWRSFSHWIGGMGILVFILIFIPESKDGSSMHLLRAESPGPQVGKIVSKMKVTARILYLIYLGMTILEIVILMLDKPIVGYEQDQLFISMVTSFGTAGTGGFSCLPGSLELYSPFSQYVVAIFMILFGCNFTLYYLLLIGKIKDILRSQEVKCYFLIIISAVALVFLSLIGRFGAVLTEYTTEEAFRHSLFHVASTLTTTGYSTTDFNMWPALAQTVLVMTMVFGAMAGSTAGGIKTSRIVIAAKGVYINIRKLINPRYVPKTKFEGKNLKFGLQRMLWGYFKKLVIADRILIAIKTMVGDTQTYTGAYVFLLIILYSIEIYADFTGGIDITIGLAESLGIRVAENFNRPFSSVSTKEYWNRWHITMGSWFTDYVFNPLSVSKPMLKLSKVTRAKLGNGFGKRISVYLATIVTWFLTGLWHGAAWNFIVWG